MKLSQALYYEWIKFYNGTVDVHSKSGAFAKKYEGLMISMFHQIQSVTFE